MLERSNLETYGIPIALAALVVSCIAGVAQLDSAADSRWKTAGIAVCIIVGVCALIFLLVLLCARAVFHRRARDQTEQPAAPPHTMDKFNELREMTKPRTVLSATKTRPVQPATATGSANDATVVAHDGPSFTVEAMWPEFQPEVGVLHQGTSFSQRTILRILVKNPGSDADFSAQASIVQGTALKYAPRGPLDPYALHDVAWEHIEKERATFGFAEKRLLFMYAFLLPEPALWFIVAENASVGKGHAWGMVVVPVDNKVEFNLIVVNQTAGQAFRKRGRIRLDPDNGMVRDFWLGAMPPSELDRATSTEHSNTSDAQRRELIKDWRAMVHRYRDESTTAAHPVPHPIVKAPEYMTLRKHLAPDKRAKVEAGPKDVRANHAEVTIVHGSTGYSGPPKILLDEIERIETEWGL